MSDDSKVVKTESKEMVEGLVSTALFPISGTDKQAVGRSGAQTIGIVWGLVGAVAGGMIARKRAAAGHEPIAGFFL